jgi:hypothetical protein
MNQPSTRDAFGENGYLFIKGLLSDEEIHQYRSLLMNDEKTKQQARWAEPDGVAKNPCLWPLIYHDGLLSHLRGIASADVRYLHHSDVQVNYDSVGWHRVSSHGLFKGEARSEDIGALRVAIYLQSSQESRFSLGVIPGTHRHTSLAGQLEKSIWSLYHRVTNGLPPWYLTLKPQWFEMDAGDCLIFDTRILHTGSKPTGPKYSIYLVFGEAGNPLCKAHYDYIHLQRRDLGYEACPPELEKILAARQLL